MTLRVLAVALLFVGSAAFGFVRAIPAPSALAADPVQPPSGDPRVPLWNAAATLEARLAVGGGGVSFQGTQLQILRPSSPTDQVIVGPDRDHPDATPTAVDQLLLGSVSGRGGAQDGTFFAQWFNGVGVDGGPDYSGPVAYQALASGDGLWRRDEGTDAAGAGWIASSDIPGFGVDPFSVQGWPDMLRRLDNVQDLGQDASGHHFSATTDPLWYPGVVAVDGAAFTASPVSVELWLDSSDRLVALFATGQNLNETIHLLQCVDQVTLAYSSPDLPALPTSQP